jgi:hypothetical protein
MFAYVDKMFHKAVRSRYDEVVWKCQSRDMYHTAHHNHILLKTGLICSSYFPLSLKVLYTI